MIKKILKDVLGENFTGNNEKYAKINSFIKQKKLSSLNSIIMGLLLIGSTIYYITLI